MLLALEAHGPDGYAVAGSGEMSLGHRLLRITPEDAFESQPVLLDGRPVLVADGRVDNRSELAAQLGISSDELAREPDSALIARAWLRWGPASLDRLVGAFAFAAWDPQKQELFLARDHAGDRPLYFRHTPELFLFATSARAIRSCPGVSSELDERQLARDLIGLPPEYPRSRFREIGLIAPGHCLTVTPQGAVHRRYWRIHSLAPVRYRCDQDYVDRFREIFDEAVRCRLRTTGEVASELSAGLDSSSVTAIAAGLLGQSGRTLTAYTAVPVPEFHGPVPRGYIADEGPYAAEVAARYRNMRHVRVDSSGSTMLHELARNFPLLDLPHAAPLNALWSDAILDHARASGVKVLLCGALGNFAASYSGSDILHALFRRGHLLRTAHTAWRLRRAGFSSGRNAASLTLFSILPWQLRRRLDPLVRATGLEWTALRPEMTRLLEALDQFRRYSFLHRSHLPRLLETQFGNNQYGDYNAAAGAGWGIDVRDPTADRRLFEFCAAIPQEQFIRGADGAIEGRALIRRAMRGRLPDATLDRREKGTQGADYYANLSRIRAELRAELAEIAKSPTAQRLLNLDLLESALEHWPDTAEAAAERAGIYQSAIPRGVSVGYFIRRIESESLA